MPRWTMRTPARSCGKGCGVASFPATAGKTYEQMLNAAGSDIGALYIMGADPASERPAWADNLDKLDFLVVQELFLTETAQKADVVLPAVSWAEQDGTFTNVERRVQRAPKAVSNPASKAAPDWMILDHLASHLGADWSYASAQGVTAEIAHAVPIYAGIDWESIGDHGSAVGRSTGSSATGLSQGRASGSFGRRLTSIRWRWSPAPWPMTAAILFRLTVTMSEMARGARLSQRSTRSMPRRWALGDGADRRSRSQRPRHAAGPDQIERTGPARHGLDSREPARRCRSARLLTRSADNRRARHRPS